MQRGTAPVSPFAYDFKKGLSVVAVCQGAGLVFGNPVCIMAVGQRQVVLMQEMVENPLPTIPHQ